MIDFHCHIDLYEDPIYVIKRAQEEGVCVLAVTTTPKAWGGLKNLLNGYSRIKAAVGIHPELIGERHQELEQVFSLLNETQYVGEIGIDGSPQNQSTFELQKEIFHKVLNRCAILGGRIMSIHSRYAAKEVLDTIEDNPDAGTAVLHWFSGELVDLNRAIKLGCWFSVGPAMTRSARGCRIIEAIPRNRILTESDGPFARKGNQPFMPWDVHEATKVLARIWQKDIQEAESQLRNNFKEILSEKN